MLSQVSVDTTEIRLKGYEASSGRATISNGMPGDIQLRLAAPPMSGLVVKLDKTTLRSGDCPTATSASACIDWQEREGKGRGRDHPTPVTASSAPPGWGTA